MSENRREPLKGTSRIMRLPREQVQLQDLPADTWRADPWGCLWTSSEGVQHFLDRDLDADEGGNSTLPLVERSYQEDLENYFGGNVSIATVFNVLLATGEYDDTETICVNQIKDLIGDFTCPLMKR